MKPSFINIFEKAGYASIWLGDFCSEDKMDEYLYKSFPADFGVITAGNGRGEMATHTEPVAIADLLKPFSESQYFASAVVAECARRNIVSSSCAMVEYGCAYDAAFVRNPDAPLKFLGAFKYDDSGNQ